MKFEYNTYLKYITKESLSPLVYISAAVIGTIICFLTSNYTVIPYLVPLIVQIIVRSNVKYRNRHQEALLELPAQKEDPVFIMDIQGNIILSNGKTKDIFEKFAIKNIKEFINDESFLDIISISQFEEQSIAESNSIETFSNTTFKWYEVKAKTTGLTYGNQKENILVWFQDISLRKRYHLRLKDLLRYSDSLIGSLDNQLETDLEYKHLAAFLLKEYEAVFITRADVQSNLNGYVFKRDFQEMIQSEIITVGYESPAPIIISRKKKEILTNENLDYPDQGLFLKENPFDPSVLNFIGVPVKNYITYNEDDISVIAFNFRSQITAYEKEFFEIVINIYRSMVMLVDLKKAVKKI